MPDATHDLKLANENPWYVLMTLFGEQTGQQPDPELREKNRVYWNAWALQHLSEEQTAHLLEIGVLRGGEKQIWRDEEDLIRERFHFEMRRRNPLSFDAPDLPSPDTEILLDETHFTCDLHLDQFIFPTSISSKGALFERKSNYNGAYFFGDADFTRATFRDFTSFVRTYFRFNGSFYYCRFEMVTSFEQSQWHGSACMEFCTFNGDFSIDKSRVKGQVCFDETVFNSRSSFANLHSLGNTYFDDVLFKGEANFSNCNFEKFASFRDSEFSAQAEFRSATFEQSVSFFNTNFHGIASFENTTFGSSYQPKTNSVNFGRANFDKPGNFRNARFKSQYPNFVASNIHPRTIFTCQVEGWPSQTEQSFEEARSSCSTVRSILANQHLIDEQHFFFRREMYFAGETGSRLQRLPYHLFGWISDYGHSIARPVWALVALWIIPALMYMARFEWEETFESKSHGTFEAFGLSFANIFRVFGFQRTHFGGDYIQNLPNFLEGLAAMQTILGFVLLFFLGLGLRQRFRLR